MVLPIPLKLSLKDFSDRTTFHGIRYISEDGSLTRRLLWIITVAACVCTVGYQIVDRVMFYYSWPVNVNMRINYNQSLTFPAVTICNQNAFKASEAAKYGYYHLIESMYSLPLDESRKYVSQHGDSNITMDQLYVQLRHNKEDFIVRCKWNGEECGPANFDIILTDHGVCYKFNGNGQRTVVTASGVEAGLRLTLNVEQYEYMAGPHDAAGVKMLLHDPRELPSVHALGQAIPTGTHAFVGIKFTEINNLPEPYGNCKEMVLEHTSYYTKEECYTSCLAKLAKHNQESCSIGVYTTCLNELEADFFAKYAADCQCPVPCEYNIYEPAISYASISKHALNKLSTTSERLALESKLLRGSETTVKMDIASSEELKVLFEMFVHRLTDLQQVYDRFSKYLANQLTAVLQLRNETKEIFSEIERLYRFQQYIVERNFLRPREAMEERTLRNVALGFIEFEMLNIRRIDKLANSSLTGSSVREMYYNIIVDSVAARQKIAQLARQNITELIKAFETGTKIFDYQFEDIDKSHTPFIVPKQLLSYSLHNNWYVKEFTRRLLDSFDVMHSSLEMFKTEATVAYFNQSFNATVLDGVYFKACREFMYSKSVFYSHGIDRIIPIIEERKEIILEAWNEFNEKSFEVEYSIIALDANLKTVITENIPSLDALAKALVMYVKTGNASLMEIAIQSATNDIQRAQRAIQDLYNAINLIGQGINDSWAVMLDNLKSFWSKILLDRDMIDYHKFTNNTKFLQNLTDVLESYSCMCANAGEVFAVKNARQNQERDFLTAFVDVADYLADFIESIKIDSTFLRDNFLQLDIFFSQLSYDHITQQVAYDFFALICDIGGSLGLFIGASMLTIVEVIDFIVTQMPLIFKKKEKKLKIDVP